MILVVLVPMTFSSPLPYRTLSSERRCLAEVSIEMQSHLFLSFFLFNLSLLSSPRKITFSSDLHFCRMVVTDERLQVRRLLIFFRIFLKMSSGESFFFPGEEMVTLKLFSFWPAHSQEIAKSSKVMG